MIFEEIQQRLDQDLEEYKDDEEREREEKKHHLYQLKQQLEQYQLLYLDTHEIVVPFHGILDLVTVHQSSKKIYLHGVDVIFPRIDREAEVCRHQQLSCARL
jgi:hypothetical protein